MPWPLLLLEPGYRNRPWGGGSFTINPILIFHIAMISAINSAAAGLQTASRNFEQAAGDIITGGIRTGAGDTGLAKGILALKQAELQVAASARVFSAIARTEERLLDIIA